jgi:hypothetical protein
VSGQVTLGCNGSQFSEIAFRYWEEHYNLRHDRFYVIETDKDYAQQDGKDGKEKVTRCSASREPAFAERMERRCTNPPTSLVDLCNAVPFVLNDGSPS